MCGEEEHVVKYVERGLSLCNVLGSMSNLRFTVYFKVIDSCASAQRHSRRDCDILVLMLKAISNAHVENINFGSKQAMARW